MRIVVVGTAADLHTIDADHVNAIKAITTHTATCTTVTIHATTTTTTTTNSTCTVAHTTSTTIHSTTTHATHMKRPGVRYVEGVALVVELELAAQRLGDALGGHVLQQGVQEL